MADKQGEHGSRDEPYLVLARRYRPRTFEELVGQPHIARALTNAIRTGRIGHAYLLTGPRGIGKTSTARIFAKCLNCVEGPTAEPCNRCELCASISTGEDVDVLEIDGASNRGIDEIRQLRSNVSVRPQRSRFKIYIIDEVHMLTPPAFNALLKTLEEPPEHVKFIFCTTDPDKVPVTVQSRCQRFDFVPVAVDQIVERLQEIAAAEGVEADPQAMRLIAQRAGGSLRDSQSLLEQLLAFSSDRITVEDVHRMLGTASTSRLDELVRRLAVRDAAGSLAVLDRLVAEGSDAGQLAEQLLGYLRDLMLVAVGADRSLLEQADGQKYDELRQLAEQIGLESLMAAAQIVDETLTRMRLSGQPRLLLEMALVRIANLERLEQLAQWIEQLREGSLALPAGGATAAGGPAAGGQPSRSDEAAGQAATEKSSPEKKSEDPAAAEAIGTGQVSSQGGGEQLDADQLWRRAVEGATDMVTEAARKAGRVAICAPNQLVVYFPAEYTHLKQFLDRPEPKARLAARVSELAGRPLDVVFEVEGGGRPQRTAAPKPSYRELQRKAEQHPLVQQAVELFEADVVQVDVPLRRD